MRVEGVEPTWCRPYTAIAVTISIILTEIEHRSTPSKLALVLFILQVKPALVGSKPNGKHSHVPLYSVADANVSHRATRSL